jgi:hypothetical protein
MTADIMLINVIQHASWSIIIHHRHGLASSVRRLLDGLRAFGALATWHCCTTCQSRLTGVVQIRLVAGHASDVASSCVINFTAGISFIAASRDVLEYGCVHATAKVSPRCLCYLHALNSSAAALLAAAAAAAAAAAVLKVMGA